MVISQETAIFESTLRDNVDPLGLAKDQELRKNLGISWIPTPQLGDEN